jgi:hypothetical protein
MCKIPKVVIVAPADRHADLRRALSSLEYDIAATVATADDTAAINADVVVAVEPDAAMLALLHALGKKTVAVGGEKEGADMHLGPDELASFKTRIWELFRPA